MRTGNRSDRRHLRALARFAGPSLGPSRARRRLRRLLLLVAAGSALATVLPASAGALVLGPGGWSYFGDPRAVHAGGRTFVGWTDESGYTRIASVRDGRILEQRRFGPRLSVDDHNNPSIYVRADGRIMLFYSDHQGPKMYIRRSRDPYSLRSFSKASTLPDNTDGEHGFTYPNPLRVDRRLWLFFRGGNFQPNYSVKGTRWSMARTLAWGPITRREGKPYRHRPYVKYESDGRAVQATLTEGNDTVYDNSIYFAEMRPGRGLYSAGGRRLVGADRSPRVTELERVRGAASRQWPLDIANDGDHPVIVYRRGADPVEYWYARFDGSRWQNHFVTRLRRTESGQRQIGSITLDHETPGTVYLSRTGSRGRLEVEVWTTPDRGRTWAHHAITHDSTEDNFRPVTPRGLIDHEEAAWFAGNRTHYRDFDTDVIVRLLEAAERLVKAGTPGGK